MGQVEGEEGQSYNDGSALNIKNAMGKGEEEEEGKSCSSPARAGQGKSEQGQVSSLRSL
jgi:hypothetical protein